MRLYPVMPFRICRGLGGRGQTIRVRWCIFIDTFHKFGFGRFTRFVLLPETFDALRSGAIVQHFMHKVVHSILYTRSASGLYSWKVILLTASSLRFSALEIPSRGVISPTRLHCEPRLQTLRLSVHTLRFRYIVQTLNYVAQRIK